MEGSFFVWLKRNCDRFVLANVIFILSVAIFSYRQSLPLAEPPAGQLSLSVSVCSEAQKHQNAWRFVVCWNKRRILIESRQVEAPDYGNRLKFSGRLQLAPVFPDFDYRAYLRRQGIDYISYQPQLSVAGEKRDFSTRLIGVFLALKQHCRSLIQSALPEPGASLALALLIGDRYYLSDSLKEVFSRIGLSHFLAVSGAHLSVIGALLLDLMIFFSFSRRARFLSLSIFFIFYPLFSGLSASAVRSAIMAWFSLSAITSGRLASPWRFLLLGASLMLAVNPSLFYGDYGFRLSFVSLIAIMYIRPIYVSLPGKKGFLMVIRKILINPLLISLAALAATWPFVAYDFGVFSWMAPISNLLLSWLFVPLLSFLFIALVLSLILPSFSLFFFFPAYIILEYFWRSASYLASFSWASSHVSRPRPIFLACYYLFFSLFLLFINYRRQRLLSSRVL